MMATHQFSHRLLQRVVAVVETFSLLQSVAQVVLVAVVREQLPQQAVQLLHQVKVLQVVQVQA
jgi:hypothetical protein